MDMKKGEVATQKTVHALLSGAHPLAKKYAGKQVFVIEDKIVALREGKKGREDFNRLKEKYGNSPTLMFVPKPGATYILLFQ